MGSARLNMKLVSTLFLTVLLSIVCAQSPIYGQCGGIGWTGPTTCASGSMCVVSNPYYSQCIPSSSAPTTSTASTSKPTTATSTAPSSTTTSSTGGSLSKPPSGAITIGPSGSGAKYSTINSGLADTSSPTYFIYSGTYNEQVLISRANIKVYGQTSTAGLLSYSGNLVTITNTLPASTAGSDDASGTVRVHATNIALYNLNIVNPYGTTNSTHGQAIALSVTESQFGGYGLKLTGYQDTFYADSGTEFVSHSWIEGAVDFIFGQTSSLWITKSVINVIGSGDITASGRDSDDANWYVIDQTTVQCNSGVSTYLGRPWRDYARVVFQECSLASCVNSAGWSVWSSTSPQTDHVTYEEYDNTGPGASGTRASFSSKISSPIAITTVLGASTSWVDSAWL